MPQDYVKPCLVYGITVCLFFPHAACFHWFFWSNVVIRFATAASSDLSHTECTLLCLKYADTQALPVYSIKEATDCNFSSIHMYISHYVLKQVQFSCIWPTLPIHQSYWHMLTLQSTLGIVHGDLLFVVFIESQSVKLVWQVKQVFFCEFFQIFCPVLFFSSSPTSLDCPYHTIPPNESSHNLHLNSVHSPFENYPES